MLRRVISGGQTGADQAALRAARRYGIETGGSAPFGWMTEDGPAPWLADSGLVECAEPRYPARTEANVRDSNATFWFGSTTTPRALVMFRATVSFRRPRLEVQRGMRPSYAVGWLGRNGVHVLNVAGNGESKAPGIGERVERFLCEVFRQLGHREGRASRPSIARARRPGEISENETRRLFDDEDVGRSILSRGAGRDSSPVLPRHRTEKWPNVSLPAQGEGVPSCAPRRNSVPCRHRLRPRHPLPSSPIR